MTIYDSEAYPPPVMDFGGYASLNPPYSVATIKTDHELLAEALTEKYL
jgi:hypothetical protein